MKRGRRRGLTLEQAAARAQQGDIDGAITAYRGLTEGPRAVEAWFQLGTLLAERGDPEGLVCLQEAASRAPDEPSIQNNLGHALREAGQLEDAAQVFAALVATRGEAVERYGLATVRLKQGRLGDAEALLAQAVARQPTFLEALRQQGEVLEALGRPGEAMEVWTRALALQPRHGGTLRKVGLLHAFFGRRPVAVAMLRQALAIAPGDALAEHMLAALTGAERPQADDGYVRDLFDAFADSFDAHLQQVLGYRVPARLAALVGGGPHGRVLDLGCGTGLMAPLLRVGATELVGVDLSGAMLDKARARGGYDRLVEASIEGFLGGLGADAHPFDLFVAADVFVYVGRLDGVFAAVHDAGRPGARFAFTTEVHEGEGTVLRASGRYAHSVAEVDALAQRHGFTVEGRVLEPLRTDGGEDVEGQYVVLGLT